jgi:hypothetical protein
MVDETMAEDPGPGAFEGRPAPGPGRGETAPGLRGRETLTTGDKRTPPIGWRGSKIVFLDFGRSKIFAVTDDSDEVLVFNNLAELAESLRPEVIVLDNLPEGLQSMWQNWQRQGLHS